MDTSISVAATKNRAGGGRSGRTALNTSSGTSLLNYSNSVMNRSKSESRVHPALSNNSKVSPGRSGGSGGGVLNARVNRTPNRLSNSLLDVSSAGASAVNGNNGRSTTPSRGGGDRFIPNRSTTDKEFAQHSLSRSRDDLSASSNEVAALAEQMRRQKLNQVLNDNAGEAVGGAAGGGEGGTRILSFRTKAPAADEAHANNLKVLYSTGKPKAAQATKTRQVSQKPEKILDAPDFVDDFYLHLLDWSSTNHLAVALTSSLFVWNADDGSIEELFSRENVDEYVCAVRWVTEGSVLAASNAAGVVELWDAAEAKILRTMSGHTDRVSCLDWSEHLLATGCRDGRVHLHDVRVADHHVDTFAGHSQEVCGTAWSNGGKLLATGANDNLCMLWDPRNAARPVHTLNQHQSAIKALAWCPWQPDVLATGGGTSDRSIKFWNSASGNCLNTIDAGSQVSSLLWNAEYRELCSAHGYSNNQLTLWSYPKMTKVADLTGHSSRILKMTCSPDGSTVASAAADETIRLWKVWPPQNKKAKKNTLKDTGGFRSQRIIR